MRKTKFFYICFMGLVFTMTAFAQIDGAETMGSFNVPYTQPVSTTSPQPVTPVSTITPQPVVIQPNQLPTAGGIPSIPQTSGSSTPPTSNGVGSTPSQGSSSGAISIPIGGSGGVNSIPTAPYAGTTPPQPTGGPSGSSSSSSSSSPPPPTTDWYLDSDGDGWHGQSTRASTSPGPKWKVTTKGYDCDDSNATKTLCDPNWYLDNDGDGWHSIFTKASTSPGTNYKTTTKGLDCDDTKATVTNECNTLNWYLDNDGDGYHITTAVAPMRPGTGWKEGVSKGLDCDDNKYQPNNNCQVLDPCALLKAQIANSTWLTQLNILRGKTSLTNESGYAEQNLLPLFPSLTSNGNDNLIFPITANTIGFMHTHLDSYPITNPDGSIDIAKPIHMFSPADITRFFQLLLNARMNQNPIEDIYGVMTSSTGTYELRFTGNIDAVRQAMSNITAMKEWKIEAAYKKAIRKYQNEGGLISFIQDTFNLTGIQLMAIGKDNSVSKVTKGADGKGVKTPCAN